MAAGASDSTIDTTKLVFDLQDQSIVTNKERERRSQKT